MYGTGQRGPHTEGALEDPFGLAVDSQGRLIISCLEGYTILRFDPSIADVKHQVECIAGRSGTRWFRDGMGPSDSLLGDAAGLTIDPFDTIYFCECGDAFGLVVQICIRLDILFRSVK